MDDRPERSDSPREKWPPKKPMPRANLAGRPSLCNLQSFEAAAQGCGFGLGYGNVSLRDASPRRCPHALVSLALSAWTLPLALLSILLAHAAPCIWPPVAGDDSRDAGSASKYVTALAKLVTASSMLH
jgi:hypothetical protein